MAMPDRDAGEWIVYHAAADTNTDTDTDFEGWLKKYRPSSPQWKDYAWIAVRGKDWDKHTRRDDPTGEKEDTCVSHAVDIAAQLAKRCAEIDADPAIPVRSNQKKGLVSKKLTREKEHALVANRLKNLAIDARLTSGKWLLFPSEDAVDPVWEKVARAIVSEQGALSGLVGTAKVATYQPTIVDQEPPRWVVCIYVDDSFDKQRVGKVFEILVSQLGLKSNAYKADLYTAAGIDSKHPSKIKSTLYNAKDFMSESEIAAALEARKAALEEAKAGTGIGEGEGAEGQEGSASAPKARPTPKPKPAKAVAKKAKGTGFVDSGSESGSATEPEEDEPPKQKKQKQTLKQKQDQDQDQE